MYNVRTSWNFRKHLDFWTRIFYKQENEDEQDDAAKTNIDSGTQQTLHLRQKPRAARLPCPQSNMSWCTDWFL